MQGYARLVTRRAGWVLAAVAAATLVALAQIVDLRSGALRLRVDPSVDRLFPEGDEARRYYDHVRRLFGSDEMLLVVVSADDVFRPAHLARLQRLTRRLAELPGVHHVTSLANAAAIRVHEGDLVVEPLFEAVPDTPAALAELRREALDNPLLVGTLVSRDGSVTTLVVRLREMPEAELIASGIDREVLRIAREERGDAEVWVTGGLRVKAEHTRLMLADMGRTLPLAIAVSVLMAFVSFRTARGVVIPTATTLIALVWTLGLVAFTGQPLDLVTLIVPPLVLILGFAYAVHVVSEYYDALALRGGRAPGGREAARRAVAEVVLAELLTGLTTAVGFLSLLLSPIPAIRRFGWFGTFGVFSALVVGLTLGPALLAVLPGPRRARDRTPGGRFDRWSARIAAFDVRRRVPILIASALVATLAAWGTTRIRVSTDFVQRGTELHRAMAAVNERLDGANAFYVVLESETPDAFKEPENLRELERLQHWLEAQPEIGGTTSLVEYVSLLNQGFHGGDAAQRAIPASRRMTAQLLFFGASEELESLVDSRYRTAGIQVRSKVEESEAMSGLVRRIEARLAELPATLRGRVTGNSVLVTRALEDVAGGQVQSLALGFVSILALLSLLFTSLRMGLLALIPNALPVLVYFGALGFSGVTLNPTTGLLGSLVLGIAVDDTIHFLTRFNAEARRLADEAKGVTETLRAVGRPVTYTSAALCMGFLVLTTSHFRNQVEFGALAAATLAFAWVVELTLMPALAARLRIVTLWDALTLDLGADPERSIPLFAGLSKTQARIVALVASVRSLPEGVRLFREGEPGGGEMYVVIDGELTASLETDRGRVVFGTLRRGDTVGEVAFFHGKRTADVDTQTEVRLLRFDRASLARLRRRYPRIGVQVYANLADVLARRVATTTEKVK